MKKKLWCFMSKTDTTKVQKFKEQCLFCCCFAFALVGLAVYYSNLLVCLLACLLQIIAKQTWATTHHNHNTFALN
jgi:hypothetical protein